MVKTPCTLYNISEKSIQISLEPVKNKNWAILTVMPQEIITEY